LIFRGIPIRSHGAADDQHDANSSSRAQSSNNSKLEKSSEFLRALAKLKVVEIPGVVMLGYYAKN
jgi:hypothetical protein